MSWSTYWGALNTRQRIGLAAGTGVVAAAAVAAAAWLLADDYVPLAASIIPPDRMEEVAQQLERARLHYRISAEADVIRVPASELGQARAAVAAGNDGAPPSVGLEIFKEADFSSTDFSQRINYQRALQGELTRTIQSMAGVRSARVHVILPEAGLFKRTGTKPSAAVTLSLRSGASLSPAQVRGIQRLVVASVPEIKTDDVVLLDESGRVLTSASGAGNADMPSSRLEVKRQVDQYLEGKLQRVLHELAPGGSASLSVDALLDERQLQVTIEEPLAAPGPKGAEHATGVILKERQSQRSRGAAPGASSGTGAAANESGDGDSSESEYEYKVGHRIEQALSAPGTLKRLTVAVALRGAPDELTSAALEQLVGNAIGVDRSRGDSVAVMLLPRARPPAAMDDASADEAVAEPSPAQSMRRDPVPPGTAAGGISRWAVTCAALLLVCAVLGWRLWRGSRMAQQNMEATAQQLREWLAKDSHDVKR